MPDYNLNSKKTSTIFILTRSKRIWLRSAVSMRERQRGKESDASERQTKPQNHMNMNDQCRRYCCCCCLLVFSVPFCFLRRHTYELSKRQFYVEIITQSHCINQIAHSMWTPHLNFGFVYLFFSFVLNKKWFYDHYLLYDFSTIVYWICLPFGF